MEAAVIGDNILEELQAAELRELEAPFGVDPRVRLFDNLVPLVSVNPARDEYVNDPAPAGVEGDHATTIDGVIRAIARVDAMPALAPGQVLDDTYELVERLGGGGMGVVFHARDRRLGRAVAIKVLKPAADPGKAAHLRRLFEREARATAQLLHPNIVTLHDLGEHEQFPYLVLELLAGETLAARLMRRRKLPISEALSILDAVLGALAFAHERGVLHRDLKPTNVFITVDERVKVLDFGVALSLDSDPGPATRAAGTPGYMAPEQQDGGLQDARTDVWAAALLLVECVTGGRPEALDAAALADIEAPAAVRAELVRALAVDPDRRPATATDLRLALGRASARLVPPIVPRRRWQHRAWLAVFGIAMLATGAGAAAAWTARDSMLAPLTPADISGTWKVNFGTLVLRVDNDGRVFGAYEHDEGTLVGRYHDGLFMGRWCEQPTQRGPKDAGVLQLQFARRADRIVVDGRWTYGDLPDSVGVAETQWHTHEAGFFGAKLDVAPPVALARRLEGRASCP
ncbi:MAG: serine/threonine-protein kinase [Kofleriaceae bacterium]